MNKNPRASKPKARKAVSKSKTDSASKKDSRYWEIEDILRERTTAAGKKEVLIKWKNWRAIYNSWQPVENLNDGLSNILDTIRKEKEVLRKEKEPRPSKKTNRPKKANSGRKLTKIRLEDYNENELKRGVIEDILDSKIENGKRYYLIKWFGYSEEYNSWEPRKNIACRSISALKQRVAKEKILRKQIEEDAQKEIHLNLNEEVTSNENSQQQQPILGGDECLEPCTRINSEVFGNSGDYRSDDYMNSCTTCMNSCEGSDSIFNEEAQLERQIAFLQEEISAKKKGSVDSKDFLGSRCELLDTAFVLSGSERSYVIQSHKCNKFGEIEAFKFVTAEKHDCLGVSITMWCDMEDARQKYPRQVLEYLFSLSQANPMG